MQPISTILNNLKLTHVEQQQLAAIECKQHVCQLLQWSEEYYAKIQFGMGRNFIVCYTSADDDFTAQLESSHMFWGWWKNHWMIRDDVFVTNLQQQPLSVAKARQLYMALHHYMQLYNEGLKPPVFVTTQKINAHE